MAASRPLARRSCQTLANMQVTAAQREDCPALAAIHIGSWQAAYASLFPAEYLASLSVAERTEAWISILEVGASRTLVAKRAGQVLGFVSFGRCRDEGASANRGEVWALYAAPQAWSSALAGRSGRPRAFKCCTRALPR
jgi:L-amino acid N-acyltransferase YncA